MKERFRPVLRFTESVYIFETELVDMDDLRHRIQEIVGFEDLEFYVFRLVDEMDMVTTIKYCREMIEYCQEENRRMFAELNNE